MTCVLLFMGAKESKLQTLVVRFIDTQTFALHSLYGNEPTITMIHMLYIYCTLFWSKSKS